MCVCVRGTLVFAFIPGWPILNKCANVIVFEKRKIYFVLVHFVNFFVLILLGLIFGGIVEGYI